MKRTYESANEFVSSAHPDRLCDLIASIVINDIQHKDGWNSHAAVEVFLTHDTVVFGGEVKTTLEITDSYLQDVVDQAYERAGYLPEMRRNWTKEEVCLAEDLTIINKIEAQSPDIALGTTDKGKETGWNDQGIFFSSSEGTNPDHMGTPARISRDIGDYLHEFSRQSILNNQPMKLGPDIKVVVTVKTDADGFTPIEITAITIAVPHTSQTPVEQVRTEVKQGVICFLRNAYPDVPVAEDCKWTINGTGRFVVHGNISDCSMTGRKISVNHPAAGPCWSNKMIGGGSQIKPAHASDLILPLAARYIANIMVDAGFTTYAVVGISGGIGQLEVQSMFVHGDVAFESDPIRVEKITQAIRKVVPLTPSGIIEKFKLLEDDFSRTVDRNFYGESFMPWENPDLIQADVKAVKALLS